MSRVPLLNINAVTFVDRPVDVDDRQVEHALGSARTIDPLEDSVDSRGRICSPTPRKADKSVLRRASESSGAASPTAPRTLRRSSTHSSFSPRTPRTTPRTPRTHRSRRSSTTTEASGAGAGAGAGAAHGPGYSTARNMPSFSTGLKRSSSNNLLNQVSVQECTPSRELSRYQHAPPSRAPARELAPPMKVRRES